MQPSLTFSEIHRQKKQQETFLELLEPFILNDRITFLNPEIMQAFVDHYSTSKDMLKVSPLQALYWFIN